MQGFVQKNKNILRKGTFVRYIKKKRFSVTS